MIQKIDGFKPPISVSNSLSIIAILYVIVIARVPEIYGSKRTESEGEARGQGLFTLP